MERPDRTRLVALVVLVAVAVPLALVAALGSGGDGDAEDEESGLRVERSPDLPELLVYLSPSVNTTERTGGRRRVLVECMDAGGNVVKRQGEPWPFTDTDDNTRDPHAHVPVNPARIGDVASCRVRPARPALEGPVS